MKMLMKLFGINSSTKNNQQPKLIIILNRIVIGGPSADIVSLASYLKQDYNILILFGEKETDEVPYNFILQQYANLQFQKIKYLRRTINPFVDFIAFISILKHIRNFQPNIVHTHGSKIGLLGRLAAWLLSVPVIIHTFHGHLFHSYFNKFISKVIVLIERGLAKISSAVVSLSFQQQKDLTDNYLIAPENKTHLIPLGVDEKIFQNNTQYYHTLFRSKYQLNSHDIAIGIIGRIVPIKNQLLFLKIAESILKKGKSNVYFFIIGDGRLKSELQSYLLNKQISFSEGLNIPDSKIIFTSWVENMATVYHGLDIVVLTSFNEGTPLSIIESQICGKPVVAVNTGGVKDTFQPNQTGFLIDGYDETKFTEKIIELIENNTLRENMGKQAVDFARTHYSKKMEVTATKNLYQQYL